jgi:nucleoid-associated protein YgaU
MAIHRYNIANVTKDKNGKRQLSTTTPPNIEKDVKDIYIYTREGDRLDLLASKYYGDRTKWTYLATANNLYDMVTTPGIQLRIPYDAELITKEWSDQNKNR